MCDESAPPLTMPGRTVLAAAAVIALISVPAAAQPAPQPAPQNLPRASAPPPLPMPASPVPAPQPVSSPVAAEPPVMPGLLHQIGQRQSELTLLELDLKRAELQRKLRELEAPVGPLSATVPTVAAAEPQMTAAGPGSPPRAAPPSASLVPVVRLIHRQGPDLTAVIGLPGGESREVRRGTSLSADLQVVDVLPGAVRVRRPGQPPYDLPGPLAGAGEGDLP